MVYGQEGNDLLDVQDDPLYFSDMAYGGAGDDWADFDSNDMVFGCQA